MTGGEILACVLILIVGSFIAGIIDVACEQRKREKEQRERERLQSLGPKSYDQPL